MTQSVELSTEGGARRSTGPVRVSRRPRALPGPAQLPPPPPRRGWARGRTLLAAVQAGHARLGQVAEQVVSLQGAAGGIAGLQAAVQLEQALLRPSHAAPTPRNRGEEAGRKGPPPAASNASRGDTGCWARAEVLRQTIPSGVRASGRGEHFGRFYVSLGRMGSGHTHTE